MTIDRRVQRTRALLEQALIDLTSERRYADITIQDIVERANVGRTTFYLHFTSKDDLFMSCHDAIISEFQSGPFHRRPLSREELLAPETPPGMVAAYQHLQGAWTRLSPIFQGKDGSLILRRIRDSSAQEIEENLRAAFAGVESAIPLDLLANYLAAAQLALVQWWLEQPYSHPPKDLAQALHRMQRAAIRDAFGLS